MVNLKPLNQQQKHWVKELNDRKRAALQHLETFHLAQGVDMEELENAQHLLSDAYERAIAAVTA